jgi:hypothetical protein
MMQRVDDDRGQNFYGSCNQVAARGVAVTDAAEAECASSATAASSTNSSSYAAAAAAVLTLASVLATLPLALSCFARVRARRKDPSVKVREIP